MAESSKKSFLFRLFGRQQKGGCCKVEIEEIPEEEQDLTPRQMRAHGRASCCGPAPKTRSDGEGTTS